jgi:hypothetical protein
MWEDHTFKMFLFIIIIATCFGLSDGHPQANSIEYCYRDNINKTKKPGIVERIALHVAPKI